MIYSAVFGATAFGAIPYAARSPVTLSDGFTECLALGDNSVRSYLTLLELFEVQNEGRGVALRVTSQMLGSVVEIRAFTAKVNAGFSAPDEGRELPVMKAVSGLVAMENRWFCGRSLLSFSAENEVREGIITEIRGFDV